MPENWKTYNLGELVDLKQGLAINKKTNHLLCDAGINSIPLFKIRDLLKDTIEHYVKADEVPKQCIAKKEDLIYSRTGQVGHIFKGKVGCIHNNCFKIIPSEKLDSEFLYHYLKNPVIRQYANDIASGSVQKDLNHTAFKSIPIKVPKNLQEQQSIASILSALDDKIALNLQMNKTLEEMAMALYKHWFVDFGPFQDGEFVNSELGEIPKGWEVKSINAFGQVVCGKTPSKKDPDNFTQIGGYPFIKIPEMHGNVFLIETVEKVSEKGNQTQAKKLLPSGCINVSCIATVGLVTINAFPSHTNQQINSIIPEKTIYRYYLYSTMISLKERFLNEASGGSATLNMNTSTFSNIKILKPDEETLQKFSELTTSIFSKILQNQEENITLTQLRDTLLPKLISGEVRVKDAEKTLTEVL